MHGIFTGFYIKLGNFIIITPFYGWISNKFNIFKEVYKSQDGIFDVDTLVGKFGEFDKEVFTF